MKRLLIVTFFSFFSLYSFAQITLQSSAVVSAGGRIEGGAYKLLSAVGQSAPVGTSNGGPYTLGSGFIQSLDNQVPFITHASVGIDTAGQPLLISAVIADSGGIAAARVLYRRGGDATFTSVPMSLSGGSYTATIPATGVTSRGLEYYVEADDHSGNRALFPSTVGGRVYTRIFTPAPGISKGTPQPGGSDTSSYRLFSIPASAIDKSPGAILDELMPYDPTRWRFFELRPDQTYIEFPNTSNMDPGKAFWLIVREPVTIFTGADTSISTSQSVPISMYSGWTFVGNPFNFPIPVSNITSASGDAVRLRYFAQPAGQPARWDSSVTSMLPFEGYAVANNNPAADVLNIDPNLSPSTGPQMESESPGTMQWSVRIVASSTRAADIDNLAGVATDASNEIDNRDEPEPPVIGDFISVYFPHPEWERPFTKYCEDIRSLTEDGQTWEFEVRTNQADQIALSFSGAENIPQDFESWVVDKTLSISANLRQNNSYVYHNLDVSNPRKFVLLVGTSAFVQGRLNEAGTTPAVYQLSQNFPNPFNPTTIIRYGLPTSSRVSLNVYDVLGRQVMTLVDAVESHGFKAVEFNANNLASGVYYYRMEVRSVEGGGEFIETKKLMLLR